MSKQKNIKQISILCFCFYFLNPLSFSPLAKGILRGETPLFAKEGLGVIQKEDKKRKNS